jgi:hypothetical protein
MESKTIRDRNTHDLGSESEFSEDTAELNIPYLPSAARLCHVVPQLGQYSLVSIGQLCDAGCDVLL